MIEDKWRKADCYCDVRHQLWLVIDIFLKNPWFIGDTAQIRNISILRLYKIVPMYICKQTQSRHDLFNLASSLQNIYC